MSLVRRWRCGRIAPKGVIAGLAVVLIACSASVGVRAEQGVMLDVRNAKLADVVMMLTQQSGANICISPDVAEKTVTAHFDGLPLDKVLDYVVKTAGVNYWKAEDGTYMIGTKKEESVQKPAETIVPVVAPVQDYAPVQRVHTEVIKLVNLHPDDVLVAIGLMNDRDNRSRYLAPGVRFDGVLGTIDEDASGVGIRFPGTSPKQHQDVGEPAPPMLDSGNRAEGDAGRAATTNTAAGQMPGMGYGRPSSMPSSQRNGRSATPGTTTNPNATSANSLLPDGVDMVMPFPTDNSLIVRGTDDGIASLKELVHLLDVPPKQVNIKAEFVEVSTNDIKKFGIDWSLERLNTTINTNFNPSGNVIIGFTSGNLAASLKAQLTKSSGRIINSPIISTINNEYATIQITSSIPYWTSTVINNNTTGAQTSMQVNYLTVSTFLSVMPRVNADGTIMLTLMPQVGDTGRLFKAPDGSTEIPETRYQTLYTRRRVMNGETIVVGGFIRKDDSISSDEIPLLGRLPLIGGLFRTKSETAQDRELLIFVTPTIIGEKSAGSSVGVGPSL